MAGTSHQAEAAAATIAAYARSAEEREREMGVLRASLADLRATHGRDADTAATTIAALTSQLESGRIAMAALVLEKEAATATSAELRRSQERVGELERTLMQAERQSKQVWVMCEGVECRPRSVGVDV